MKLLLLWDGDRSITGLADWLLCRDLFRVDAS